VLYADPAVALGSVVLWNESAGATVSVTGKLAVAGVENESFTVMVKLKVPVCDVVPEMTPVLPFKVSPVGSAPAVIDQV
jgi:hypothetical protein